MEYNIKDSKISYVAYDATTDLFFKCCKRCGTPTHFKRVNEEPGYICKCGQYEPIINGLFGRIKIWWLLNVKYRDSDPKMVIKLNDTPDIFITIGNLRNLCNKYDVVSIGKIYNYKHKSTFVKVRHENGDCSITPIGTIHKGVITPRDRLVRYMSKVINAIKKGKEI